MEILVSYNKQTLGPIAFFFVARDLKNVYTHIDPNIQDSFTRRCLWCEALCSNESPSLPGCLVSGLYLEGADWDVENACLVRSKPKVLVAQLPILKVIPIEAHRLKLQVGGSVSSFS